MLPNTTIIVVSFILSVIVAFGVIILLPLPASGKSHEMSTKTKVVTNICSYTSYQESCQKSLEPVNGTNPKEFVVRAILAAEEEVEKFFGYSDSCIFQVKNDSRKKMALDECKDMMSYAIESLRASVSHVDNAQLHNISECIPDLRTWLSSVISYQQSCLDGFEYDNSMKEAMAKGIKDASELASNALAIVTKLSDILAKYSLQLNLPNFPRLRSVEKQGNGYPSWFSNIDRKLLTQIDHNHDIKPNVVVAKDGSGQFNTIAAALAAAPKKSNVRHVIYVKAGIYDEQVVVDKQTINILMYGDGPRKTIVTGNKSFADGTHTWKTSTFSAIGDGFIARSMGFHNTAGPEKQQAVALRVQSDKSAFFNCRMDAYQGTLYNQANRQFFRNCIICGTVDFIFGDSPVVIQNSLIIVRRPMETQVNTVTAQGKSDPNENTGIVIQNCRIIPEERLVADRFKIPTYLGRPWKKYSTTVVMESTLSDFIRPEGWTSWTGSFFEDTLYYAEYNNRDLGAHLDKRVTWAGYHKIDNNTAMKFTPQSFLSSHEDWMLATGVPYIGGLAFR